MIVLGRLFLNSRKDRRKDAVFLDVEELTFLITKFLFNTPYCPLMVQ